MKTDDSGTVRVEQTHKLNPEILAAQEAAGNDPPRLTRALLITMAVACGLAIANLFYNQPLLGQIQRSFHATYRQVGTLPALTQIGFAVGVFLLAPLGDILERRRLILTTLALVTCALFAAALSPTLLLLALVSLMIGVTSVISTLVMPFAVSLSPPEERGKTVGTLASAMLIGILLSRTLAGQVGEALGWRGMYAIAGGLMILLALVLRILLPRSQPQITMPYPALIGSMFRLFKEHRLLREATYNGFLLYGGLSAFWATLVFLVEGPPYHYGPAAAGMFGLVAAAGATIAPLVGKLTDRRSPRTIVGFAAVLMLLGYLILWAFGTHLTGLIAGVIVLDLAAQAATISNQASVYSLPPEAHSRCYTVYRAAFSLGGSFGAYLGVLGWSFSGWSGVCGVGITLILLALALHLFSRRFASYPM